MFGCISAGPYRSGASRAVHLAERPDRKVRETSFPRDGS